MAQPPRLNGAVVAVHGATGPHGVGFLATEDVVITCAHVVCQALGLPLDHSEKPEDPVTLEFLLLDGCRVGAEVAVWRPRGGEKPDDIAVLRLTGSPPEGAEPTRLSPADDLWGHQVAAFGVPKDNEKDGAWATGELRGKRAGGLIQVDDNRTTGFTIQQGFSGSPVWDEEAGGVVGMVISAGQRRRFACIVPTSALTDLWPPASLPPSPYRGLLSFREEDATLYYGRDGLADTLAEEVRARRVTVVVGPSGYGKSSLVAAGVLPRLRDRPELSVAGPIRPRGNPAHEVAGALLELLQPAATPAQQLADRPAMAEMIADGRLDEVVGRLLDRTGAGELLLIIDQLEEALDRGSAAVAALAPVIRCAFAPESRLRVLLVIRSDFLDRALAKPELAEGLREACTVGAMTREQLHAAVTGPLRDGVTFETGLDELIVAEVADAPGQLPLLQSVLDQLWQRQERGKLTHRAYADLGGVSGALARYAEKKGWLELAPDDRAVARQLFMRLVRIAPDLPTTRRPVRRDQLDEREWRLAQRLVAARLLVSGRRETVELAHEALISHWDRLRDWIDEDREFRVWHEGIQEQADRWQRGGRWAKDLLKKPALPHAEHWLRTRPDDLNPNERTLVRRSLRARRAKWRRTGIAVAVVVALFAGYLADLHYKWLPMFFGNPAEQLALDVGNDPSVTDTVLLRTIAAYNTDPDNAATISELYDRYEDTRLVTRVLTDPRPNVRIDEVVASVDGHMMVTRSAAGATLWHERDGQMVWTKLRAPAPDDIAVTTDGVLVALAGDRRVRLFDDRGRKINDFPVQQPDDGAPARMTVAVTTGMVASWSSDDSAVRVWDVAGQEIGSLPVGKASRLRMWFAGDHHTLIIWTAESAEVRAWNPTTKTGEHIADASRMAVMNATGDTLVTCHVDGEEPSMRIQKLTVPGHSVESRNMYAGCGNTVMIDPSGQYLSISSASSGAVYDLPELRAIANYSVAGPPTVERTAPLLLPGPGGLMIVHLSGPSVLMYSIRFGYLETYPHTLDAGAISSDGSRLATVAAYEDESLIALWGGHSHEVVKGVRTPGEARSIEFDSSSRYLVVTFTERHDIEIYAVPSLELLHTIPLPASERLAPPLVRLDGRGHLVASHGNEISRWELATGKQVGMPLRADAPEGQLGATVFTVTPDSGQVVAVSADGRGLVVWNLSSHLPPRHVRVDGVTLTGVLGTPWPETVLVLRSDISSSVLELWNIARPEPTRTVLEEDLIFSYSIGNLKKSVGFTRDRIIRVDSRKLRTWSPTGVLHGGEIDIYADSEPLAVEGMTVLWDNDYGDPAADLMEPDRWRDRLCDVLGTPDPAQVADLPAGIDTDNLCPA